MTYTQMVEPDGSVSMATALRDDGAVVCSDDPEFEAWLAAGNKLLPSALPTTEIATRKAAALKTQALATLKKTDDVATRCFKAGVEFPADWQACVQQLRAVMRGESNTIPTLPAYSAGTQ